MAVLVSWRRRARLCRSSGATDIVDGIARAGAGSGSVRSAVILSNRDKTGASVKKEKTKWLPAISTGAIFLVLAGCLGSQEKKENRKYPDLGGVWENISGWNIDQFTTEDPPGDDYGRAMFEPASPPYKGEFATRWEEVQAAYAAGTPINDPTAECVWPGVPRVIWNPFAQEIIISDDGKRVTILYEYMSQVRRIFTDGGKHPDPGTLEPTYNGYSIGFWDDNTLVIDTVGLRADTMIQNTGMMHSDALEVKERWYLESPDILRADISMVDDKAFSAPYVTSRLYRRHRDWAMVDYMCEENNRELIVNGVTTHKK